MEVVCWIIIAVMSAVMLAAIGYMIFLLAKKLKSRRTEIKEGTRKKLTFKEWWAIHKPSKRRLIQIYAALLYNINIKGFVTGQIYRGDTKAFCVPGLNCYSCPGAVAACPLGALQNALAGKRVPYYIFGIIMLYGILFGRTICGFLCPVGLGQELLYKIKTPKLKKSKVTYVLSYFKYIVLALFVIAIPVIYSVSGVTIPAFCKYLCPGGTLGGAIFLLAHPGNAAMYEMLGWLFLLKFCVLVVFIVASVFIFRVFCRFFCPLGALYGLFNRFAPLGVKLDRSACCHCGKCKEKCNMDIRHVGDHECINCGECAGVCPTNAIKCRGFWYDKKESTQTTENQAIDTSTTATNEISKTGKPNMKRCWVQIVACVVALVVLVGAGVYYNFLDEVVTEEEQKTIYEVGDICSDFSLDVYGSSEQFTLSEHSGQIVVLNFWYTECGPCVLEMPSIAALADTYQNVVFVAIHSSSHFTNKDDIQNFLDTQNDTLQERKWADYKIVFAQDTGGRRKSDIFDRFNKDGTYPTTVIIDANGVIQWIRQGNILRGDTNYLKNKLDEIIG